ncbi:IPT/TIG domain-containing protein [Belliella marina]|uniref:IPT/TIG domain-containing protein n=1 Tax=Belliella marina TaxID=1644146 RepID=A0ABW4VSA6_9BACT
MKNQFLIFFLFGLFLLLACEKQEFEPRTSPRFTLTYVQSIDSKGVEFAANMIDYGSESILEHGFIYSDSQNLTLENGEVVSRNGKPNKQFKIRANHSMIEGRVYYVAAYLLTPSGIILSQFIPFVSKGSQGFIFNSISTPNEVYYGDTITVHGSNFSSNPANYEIYILGTPQIKMEVVEISNNSFKAILPPMFSSTEIKESGTLRFFFHIGGKELEINWPIKLKEPTFEIDTNLRVNFEGEVTIKGDYLESDIQYVRFLDEPYFDPQIISWEKDKIVFKANKPSRKKRESIGIHIRGKIYQLENVYTYYGSQLEPNQELKGEIGPGSRFELKGSNFILGSAYSNQLLIEPSGINGNVMEVHQDRILVELNFNGIDPVSRTSFISMYNAQLKSNHSAKLTLDTPTLPYSRHENIVGTDYDNLDLARGINVGEKTFFVWRNKILEFNAQQKKLIEIKNTQISSHNLGGAFTVSSPDGKIYMGSYNREYYWEYLRIFEFDTYNNSLKELPRPPHNVSAPRYVYVSENHLYLDGGFTRKITKDEEITDRYRINLHSSQWEKLEMESQLTNHNQMMNTFYFKDKLYAIGNLIPNENQILQEFDKNTLSWTTIKDLNSSGVLKTNQPCIIGDELFLFNDRDQIKINMSTLKEEKINNFSNTLSWNKISGTITSKGKIYTYIPGLMIYETDPEFFYYDDL